MSYRHLITTLTTAIAMTAVVMALLGAIVLKERRAVHKFDETGTLVDPNGNPVRSNHGK